MRLTKNRLGILVAHGLHDAEARVYLALLEHPSMTAATLARLADVPRSHLYKVLQDLSGRGLVEILLQGNARSYRARPLKGFLENRANELRQRLEDLDREIETIAGAFEPPPLDAHRETNAGDIRIAVGRRAVAREIEILLDSAKTEIVLAASHGGYERALRHANALLESKRAKPCPRIELILPPNAKGSPQAVQIRQEANVTLRWSSIEHRVISVIVDACRLLLVNPIPDTADLRIGRDFAVYSGDRAFVENSLDLIRAATFVADEDEHEPSQALRRGRR